MLGKGNAERYSEVLPGIRIKSIVHGKSTLMVRFLLNKGSVLPLHKHPYEQTGYLVQGGMRLSIGGRSFEVKEGDSWCIESDVEHSSVILEDSIAVEVFSPVRQDYLSYFHEQDAVLD